MGASNVSESIFYLRFIAVMVHYYRVIISSVEEVQTDGRIKNCIALADAESHCGTVWVGEEK